jgi:hypothetical protein
MRTSRPVSPLPVKNTIRRTQFVAKPNYQFEKRRRDLEKKAKKEEKRLRKLDKSADPNPSAVVEPAPEGGEKPV